jgi:hypothetical protein
MQSLSNEARLGLVQGQLDAYNQRDIEKFCQYFDPDVEAFDLNKKLRIINGMTEFRERYSQRFSENPDLHCEIRHRTILSETIMDEEWVTGVRGSSQGSHVVAIYHFNQSKISKVFFTR